MSLTKVSYSMIDGGVVNVLDFGAVGDGVTDDQPAVQAALTYLFATGKNTLYFPDGHFYFATPLTVTFTVGRSLRIIGTSCAGMTSGLVPPGGTRLSGAAGIEAIILLTNAVLTSPIFYGFECCNINFQQVTIATGAVCAIKNLVGNGPTRPFVVKNCNFLRFSKAISSDLSQAIALNPAISTGVCVATITQNSFYYNGYALYGKGLGAWMNLNFVGNNCEQNGSGGIFTETLGIAAGCNITDNLLEGQPNAIVLSCGLAMVNIERNYFEGNSDTLISVTCSNNSSRVRAVNNYNITTGTSSAFNNCVLEYDETIEDVNLSLINGKSKIGGSVRYAGASAFNTISLDVNSISKLTSVFPATVTGGGYSAVSASPQVTPIGAAINVEAVSTIGTTKSYSGTSGFALNDWIVFQALVQKVAGTTAYIQLLTAGSADAGSSEPSYSINAAKGEWLYIQIIIRATTASASSLKYRWISDGTINVTDTYIYKIPTQDTIGPVYVCLPNP